MTALGDGFLNWNQSRRPSLDKAVKVLPHAVGTAIARCQPAGGEMDTELAIIKLSAVCEVGAGNQQVVIGYATLHVKHGGSIARKVQRTRIKNRAALAGQGPRGAARCRG